VIVDNENLSAQTRYGIGIHQVPQNELRRLRFAIQEQRCRLIQHGFGKLGVSLDTFDHGLFEIYNECHEDNLNYMLRFALPSLFKMAIATLAAAWASKLSNKIL
jgi:hypothetical protein